MKAMKFIASAALAAVMSATAADFWEVSKSDDWKRYPEVSFSSAKPYSTGFTRAGVGIALENTDPAKAAGAGWFLKLNQKSPATVRFTAEAMAEGELKGDGLQLFADITYADGSALQAQKARFAVNPALGWHRRTLEIIPQKPISTVSLYTMLYRTGGKARFRNVEFTEFSGKAGLCRFDSVMVKRRSAPEKSGLYIRDAALDDGFAPVEGAEVKGILISKKVERKGNVRLFDLEMSAKDQKTDRAVTVMFAVPMGAEGGVWHDDPRTDVKMTGDGEYINAVQVPYGAGMLTKWPLGAVSTAKRSVAIGIDPEWPAVYRIAANHALGVLYIAFDIGLAPEHNRAKVKFAVFPFEKDKGMRGALAAYDKIYPMAFERRIPEIGTWQVTTPISSIVNHEDFGFKYMEGGGTWKWDDAHGIYTFKYTEPGSWWMDCKGKDGGLPTIADCIEKAKSLLDSPNERTRARAKAWTTSVAKDETGAPTGRIQIAPWTKGIMWCLNSTPGINGGDNDYWTKNSEKDFAERYKEEFPKGVDGEYIDSAEMCFNFGCDYDRNHFAGTETPLCFGKDNKRVCASGAMASYEYVRKSAQRLRARGRYVQANSGPHRTSLLMPWVDVPGTEIKWYRSGGKWMPDSDRVMLYRRAVCGRKPYCFLQNTEFDEFHGYVERYMQRSLAYGMLCGFFSSNGYTDCYFSKRERYEKDRHLFKKYIPLQCELAKAGWTPIATLAESSNAEVFVEQFGKRYVTVFNGSLTEAKTARISSPRKSAIERVTGEKWDFSGGAKEITLPPETVRMLDFGE